MIGPSDPLRGLQGWAEGPLLGFDTETTGVSVANDRIVTAALVRRSVWAPDEVRTWLIDPGIEIPENASAIHGITTEHAREFGQPPAIALAEIAQLLAESLAAGEPVVAYNASFDLTILEVELRRNGLPTLAERLGRAVSPVVDPLVLDRHLDRFRRGKRKLVDLCAVYGVDDSDGLHTAEVDVIATLEVLQSMLRRHPDLALMDLTSLHAAQAEAHRAWAENFNSWRLSRGLDGPGAELTWPLHLDG